MSNRKNYTWEEETVEYLNYRDKSQRKYRDSIYDAESDKKVEKELLKRKDNRRKFKWNRENNGH